MNSDVSDTRDQNRTSLSTGKQSRANCRETETVHSLETLKTLFLKFSRQCGGDTNINKCFSLIEGDGIEQFYQKACSFCTSIANSQGFFSRLFFRTPTLTTSDREFLICFVIKGISPKISEETNKAILSLLINLLESNELKRKYSQEIVKRAMTTGYSF